MQLQSHFSPFLCGQLSSHLLTPHLYLLQKVPCHMSVKDDLPGTCSTARASVHVCVYKNISVLRGAVKQEVSLGSDGIYEKKKE